MPLRLLLCDDDLAIVRAAEFKLSRAGYEVECAGDGQAGWEAIQRQRPDLLVTDCQMPRMTGLQLCEAVRGDAATRDLPIIMLTAKGYELTEAEVRQRYGVLKLVAKPFSPRELLKSIDAVLRGDNPAPACGESAQTIEPSVAS